MDNNMESDQRYLSNIQMLNISPVGFIYVDPLLYGRVFENVTCIEFTNLYSNLLVKFYDNNIFENLQIKIDKDVVEKVRYFLQNKDSFEKSVFDQYQIWTRNIYLKELKDMTNTLFCLYYQYISQYFKDVLESNDGYIYYIDTDMIYFSGDIDITPDINVPYRKLTYKYFCIEGKKRFISYNGEFKIKGYSLKSRAKNSVRILTQMKNRIREDKLSELLNETK